MSDKTDYSAFVQLYETNDSIEANEYLDCGWKLLDVVKTQVADNSWSTYYVLGWNNSIDVIVRGRNFIERMASEIDTMYPEIKTKQRVANITLL